MNFIYHGGDGTLVYGKMAATDETRGLLQSICNELIKVRNEQRKTNERLTSIEKLVHADIIHQEIQDARAEFKPDETALINYIRKNPGQSKSKIIEVFEKGRYNNITMSRKVTLKRINELKEEYGIFKFEANSEQHKQRQCVYINDKSLLLDLGSIMREFREAVVAAIESYPIKWDSIDQMDKNPEKMHEALLYYSRYLLPINNLFL